jgi:hypothetical protein
VELLPRDEQEHPEQTVRQAVDTPLALHADDDASLGHVRQVGGDLSDLGAPRTHLLHADALDAVTAFDH